VFGEVGGGDVIVSGTPLFGVGGFPVIAMWGSWMVSDGGDRGPTGGRGLILVVGGLGGLAAGFGGIFIREVVVWLGDGEFLCFVGMDGSGSTGRRDPWLE